MAIVAERVGRGLRTEDVSSLEALHALRAEWEQLEDEATGATMYQAWAWVASWYEHFGRGKPLYIAAVRTAEGKLVGVAPCSLDSAGPFGPRLLHILGRGDCLSEYPDLLVHPEYAEAVVATILAQWDRRRSEWDLIRLPGLRGNGPLAEQITRLAPGLAYRLLAESKPLRIARALPDDWGAFYESLGRNQKKHLKKFANRLERDGHEPKLVVIREAEQVDSALDVFFDLHRRRAEADLGVPHEEKIAGPAARAFLRTAARRSMERDRFWVFLLYIKDEPVAAQLCFGQGTRFYPYYSGFDPKWAWYAVMMLLFRRCIERAIEWGYRELDLGLGLDQEKLRWGGEPHPIVSLTLAGPGPRSQLLFLLFRALRSQPLPSDGNHRRSAVARAQERLRSLVGGRSGGLPACVDLLPLSAALDPLLESAARMI